MVVALVDLSLRDGSSVVLLDALDRPWPTAPRPHCGSSSRTTRQAQVAVTARHAVRQSSTIGRALGTPCD
jgi:hypothetical protein